jgi:hypothetical protein
MLEQCDSVTRESESTSLGQDHEDVQTQSTPSAAAMCSSLSTATSVPCYMLRNLITDSGAQFALTTWLILSELAVMHVTCQTWKLWLEAGSLLSMRRRRIRPSQIQLLLKCGWALRRIDAIELIPEKNYTFPDLRGESLQLAFTVLPALPRLQRLMVRTPVNVLLWPPSILFKCFRALMLIKLHVTALDPAEKGHLTDAVLQTVGVLTGLTHLQLESQSLPDGSQLDFSGLTHLRLLNTLIIENQDLDGYTFTFPLTLEQVHCLTLCPALTHISCGSFHCTPQMRGRRSVLEVMNSLLREKPLLEWTCTETFVAGFVGRDPPLTHLHLLSTCVTPDIWASLAQLTHLKELRPYCWSAAIPAQQWSSLASFANLQTLEINVDSVDRDGRSTMSAATFWPALLHCKYLNRLLFGSQLAISLEQMQQLVQQLPQLTDLRLTEVFVDSMAPMEGCTMTKLVLISCKDALGYPAQMRSMLPSMPQLSALHIEDATSVRLTPADAEALNAALMMRMPKLRSEQFKQNLLP